MELGDKVTYYTHDSSEAENFVRDQLAFIVGITPDEKVVDLMVCPPKGPIQWVRVSQYDPEDIYLAPGGSYWRESGSEAPNLGERFRYNVYPEWSTMLDRQRAEVAATPTPGHAALAEKHKKEQEALAAKLSKQEGAPA